MTLARKKTAGRQITGPAPITVDISRRKEQLLRVYRELKTAKSTYIANMGGGGSGKSHGTGQYLAKRIFERREKMLVIRKFATSLNDSVVAQFKDSSLPFWDLREKRDWKYNKTNRTLTTSTGSEVLFRGLDNPEKFKSIHGITLVWIEEATELSENDFKILNDRIRGEPQIILTYNPISERHWIRKRFHGAKPQDPAEDNITVIFSTYLDNPFVGQKYIDSMNWYKENDPDHYRIYGLGEFGIIRPANPYFTAYKPILHLGLPEYQWGFPIYVSVDFNVENTFLISQHKEGMGVDYLDCWHGGGDLEQLCGRLAAEYGHGPIYFTGDKSGNAHNALTTGNKTGWELIQGYMQDAGAGYLCDYSRVPIDNPHTSSNRHVINALMTHFGDKIQIHREKCSLLIDDFERCEALSDGRLNKPDADRNDYGHAADAFRYDLTHFEFSTYQQLRQWGRIPSSN